MGWRDRSWGRGYFSPRGQSRWVCLFHFMFAGLGVVSFDWVVSRFFPRFLVPCDGKKGWVSSRGFVLAVWGILVGYWVWFFLR